MKISVDECGDVIVRLPNPLSIPPGFSFTVTNQSDKLVAVQAADQLFNIRTGENEIFTAGRHEGCELDLTPLPGYFPAGEEGTI